MRPYSFGTRAQRASAPPLGAEAEFAAWTAPAQASTAKPPTCHLLKPTFAIQNTSNLPHNDGMKSKEGLQTPAIQVLERMFALLDVLAQHQDPVSLKALSEATGLHPSTAHRILNDLTIGRFVDRPEAGSYRLGMRMLEMGNLVKARLDVRDAALPAMRELHKFTHQPVNLSVRQGDEIVYIERTYSERSGMQVVRAVGGRAPLHLTSVGKLFLASDDSSRVRAYATRTGLSGHTRNSLTDIGALERELAMVRQRGVARDDEELELGVRCMAAGIYDDQAKLVAGLSISAPADRLEEGWVVRLKETAAQISAALGHRA
jgi:DNA-binding IclR family transcriptional regulator